MLIGRIIFTPTAECDNMVEPFADGTIGEGSAFLCFFCKLRKAEIGAVRKMFFIRRGNRGKTVCRLSVENGFTALSPAKKYKQKAAFIRA